jgi:hypothetical protein
MMSCKIIILLKISDTIKNSFNLTLTVAKKTGFDNNVILIYRLR